MTRQTASSEVRPAPVHQSRIFQQCLILARANSQAAERGPRPPAGRLLRGPWRAHGAA